MQEQELRSRRRGIVYDADLLRKSSLAASDALFDLEAWRTAGALDIVSGGRASVAFIRRKDGDWVLRHYRRGGLIAKFVRDRYVWIGAAQTRAFREWRLLAQLRDWDLPVPAPVAARYERSGLFYRADLITAAIPHGATLAQSMGKARVAAATWSRVGATIARFHARGVQHADLNAHNILIDREGAVFVLDFDRGRVCEPGAWEHRVLARLKRSLVKVADFDQAGWDELARAYDSVRSP